MRSISWRLTLLSGSLYAMTSILPAQQPLWVRHNTLGDYARAMLVDGSGNIYVTGQGRRPGTNTDYITVKYDPAGNLVWERGYAGETTFYDDIGFGIAEDVIGNVIVTGRIGVTVFPDSIGTGYGTVKYDLFGSQVWERKYRGEVRYPLGIARAIATDALSNIYVTGLSRRINSYNILTKDIVTVGYGPDGDQRWVSVFESQDQWEASGNAIKVDALTGSIYVAGHTQFRPILIRYNSSGNRLWHAIEGEAGGEIRSIAIDTQGNVYVIGSAQGSTSDFFTSKYNSAGVRLWRRVYDGSGNDSPGSVEVDIDGNVYVTGRSQGTDTGIDYVTAKYDTNGNLQWVRRYHHGEEDQAFDLAVGFFSGEVYVTGRSSNKIATVKYDTNGNQQWVRRYEHRTGEGIQVSLYEYELGIPTIYVAGTTQGDYTLIKYPSCYVEGDVDGNCCVDDADLLEIVFNFGQTGIDLQGDLNSDGIVDDADLAEVMFHFGEGC